MENYRGFIIDTETSQPNSVVLNVRYEKLYSTSIKGKAKAFIDGLLYDASFKGVRTCSLCPEPIDCGSICYQCSQEHKLGKEIELEISTN